MYYNFPAGQNQSEKKGFVTPSFCPSCCNVTLEKIDQEMYFWSRLSIIPSLWPLSVASVRLFDIERIFSFAATPQVVATWHLHPSNDLAPPSFFHLSTMTSLFLPVSSHEDGLIFFLPLTRRKVVACFAGALGTTWNSINAKFTNSSSSDAFALPILPQHATNNSKLTVLIKRNVLFMQ